MSSLQNGTKIQKVWIISNVEIKGYLKMLRLNEKNTTFNGVRIPTYMWNGLESYINYGVPPGHFLTAVLENKFVDAVFCADAENQRALITYAHFLYWICPNGAWGSKERVDKWVNHNGLSGLE